LSEDDKKPPLDAALRHLAEQQRRSLTSHPTPQELAAYHAGELPPEAETRILDHLAICRECSDLLLDLAGFADLKPPQGVPELTDEQVEQDWQALRSRMRAGEGEGRKERTAEIVPIRPAVPVPRPARWSSPWLPVAASLLAVFGFSFGLYQGVQMGKLSQPRWVHIVDEGATDRGPEEGQSFSTEEPVMIRFNPYNPKKSYPSYEAEIVREDKGEVVKRLPAKTIDEELLLLIPARSLATGRYRAYLYGIDEGTKDELSEGGVAFNVIDP
jgi:hypothetical protein